VRPDDSRRLQAEPGTLRIQGHAEVVNPTGKTYTRKTAPWNLAWPENNPDRVSAVRRERQIKEMKSAGRIRENLP